MLKRGICYLCFHNLRPSKQNGPLRAKQAARSDPWSGSAISDVYTGFSCILAWVQWNCWDTLCQENELSGLMLTWRGNGHTKHLFNITQYQAIICGEGCLWLICCPEGTLFNETCETRNKAASSELSVTASALNKNKNLIFLLLKHKMNISSKPKHPFWETVYSNIIQLKWTVDQFDRGHGSHTI